MKHRCAIVLAVLALIAIAVGAFLTSEIRTFPGATTPSTVSAPSLEQAHRIAGYALAILTIGLAIWASNLAGWLALSVAIDILVGAFGSVPVLHAFNAQVFFAVLVGVAVQTSTSWQAGPQPVESPWRPLRILSMLVPFFVLLQVYLGAELRHNTTGVLLWHILNAMVVILVVLVAGVFVLRHYPEHPVLRPAALTLVIVAGVQVLLGFSVYMVLLVSEQNNVGLMITGVLHVVNGALTLAASIVFAMQMKRNLIKLSGA
jgi:heme A synthase